MTEKLIERIIEFNKIKYGSENDNESRFIIATLKPNSGYTWKQEADDMIEEHNQWTVTTASKNKE